MRLISIIIALCALLIPIGAGADLLFTETFDDTNLSGRGWYDNTSVRLSTSEHIPGSTSSLEYHFQQGATKPVAGGATRRKFQETDSLYIRYYVKYSTNWQGSNQPYHPHEIYLLTNLSNDWSGLAYTNLTIYVEQNEGKPHIGIQDSINIDSSNIRIDLSQITENRAVAGCNGDSDGHGVGDCYSTSGVYRNGKKWRADAVYFQDATGPFYKADWHLIEVFLKLNTISNGKAMADGVVQYYMDGNALIDHQDAVFRTGQHPGMKINQIIIAPYIGTGSPIDQTFWIDNMTLDTAKPGAGTPQSPQPPANLRVVGQ